MMSVAVRLHLRQFPIALLLTITQYLKYNIQF